MVSPRDQVHYNGSPVALAAGPNRLDARRGCNRRRIHHQTRPFSLVRSSCSRRTGLTSSRPMQVRKIFKCAQSVFLRASFATRSPLFLSYFWEESLSLFIRLVNERILEQRGTECSYERNPFIPAILFSDEIK